MFYINITDEDLKLINKYTCFDLGSEDVYTFKMGLCDNKIDKDCERFSVAALIELSQLYMGKTGFIDNDDEGHRIVSRIYKCVVVADYNNIIDCGEPYVSLEAYAYIHKFNANKKIITWLEGLERKESGKKVEISLPISKVRCSICNQNIGTSSCPHIKGNTYDGEKCYHILDDPTDAYDWSVTISTRERK